MTENATELHDENSTELAAFDAALDTTTRWCVYDTYLLRFASGVTVAEFLAVSLAEDLAEDLAADADRFEVRRV